MLHNFGIIYNAVYGTKIMTDCGNKQIFLGSTWSSYPPRFIQNNLFSEETQIYILPHKIPAFVYSICFHNPKIPAV